jgi:hypothetical protein
MACHTRYGVHGGSMCLIPSTDAARDRQKADRGQCEGRRSYSEARPEVVELAKQMSAQRMSLRKSGAGPVQNRARRGSVGTLLGPSPNACDLGHTTIYPCLFPREQHYRC